jgi:hypothetical protein
MMVVRVILRSFHLVDVERVPIFCTRILTNFQYLLAGQKAFSFVRGAYQRPLEQILLL